MAVVRLLAACSLGGAGHLQPLLPFLDAAAARGDECLVVGPPALGPMAHPFRPGGEPPEAEVASLRERLPVAPAGEATALAARELFGRMATAAMLPAMAAAFDDWRPDLVLREPCEHASAVESLRRGVPVAQVAISVAQGEMACIRVARPELEAHAPGLAASLCRDPYLTRFPASLDPSPFATTLRYREPAAPPGRPLPDWWGGSGAPLVYVTFGTVLGHMAAAGGVYRAALRAVGGLDVRVLLTVGRRVDVATLGPVPANVHVEAWVEQADALAAADLVVCHGGSGTAYGALAAGVPLVVAPLFADQFENARRIAAAGAAVVVETGRPGGAAAERPRRPLDEGDALAVAAAVTRALGDPSLREAARRIADEMAAAPTAGDVLATLVPGGRLVVGSGGQLPPPGPGSRTP